MNCIELPYKSNEQNCHTWKKNVQHQIVLLMKRIKNTQMKKGLHQNVLSILMTKIIINKKSTASNFLIMKWIKIPQIKNKITASKCQWLLE